MPEPKPLEQFSKKELADLAAMLFNYQLLGPTVLLDFAERMPWLVERAPKRQEMDAILSLARRGLTVATPDDQYYTDCRDGGSRLAPEEEASDRGLLQRLLADMDRCYQCKTRPVTKQYSYLGEAAAGGSLCCDECLPAVEAEIRKDFSEFRSGDTKNAVLVRELVARVG